MDIDMTDKEFKKLGRTDLINIIYKLQLDDEKLREANLKLEDELEEAKKQIPTAEDMEGIKALRMENERLAAELAAARKHVPSREELQKINAMREDNKRLHMLEAQIELMGDLEKENDDLREQLKRRPTIYSETGSIADAVVELTGIFKVAQETADKYISEVKKANEEAVLRAQSILASAELNANGIVEKAKAEAESIRAAAQADVAAKWNQFNSNVSNVLKAHSELSDMLGLNK